MASGLDAGAALFAIGREQSVVASNRVNPVPSASDLAAALLAERQVIWPSCGVSAAVCP
jgi:hypothetical protein